VPAESQTGRRPAAAGALLEREAHLSALVALFDGAAGGHGGLALVEGAPVAGKSALLDEAAPAAGAAGLVIRRARPRARA
jgi:hypothetical protein